MNTLEKSQLIADSLSLAVKKHLAQIKKSNKKLIKSIGENNDYNGITNFMMETLDETSKSMDDWEEKALTELEGLTPRQYFDNLTTINDIVDLVSLMEEENIVTLPNGLSNRIKRLEDSSTNDLLIVLQSLKIDESKCFNSTQKAVVHIVEISALPKFGKAIADIIYQLDEEKTDEDTFLQITDAIREIGEPTLETLIQLVDDNEKKGRIYMYLMLTIGQIASENKSEQIYSLLKNYFRKSETKVVEADALAMYGDGRAIPAIRGYMERNIEELSCWEYSQLREAVLQLGGNTSDLDEYFDDYDEEFDDCDDCEE